MQQLTQISGIDDLIARHPGFQFLAVGQRTVLRVAIEQSFNADSITEQLISQPETWQ